MKYNLTQDRVAINGDDANFPYPLKLWYDDKNIYVKVIRIPKYYELKQNKFAMRLKDIITNVDHDDYKSETAIAKHMSNSAYLNHLSVFIETKQTSIGHCAYSRRKEFGGAEVIKHKFSVRGGNLNHIDNFQFKQIQVGDVYSISIYDVMTCVQRTQAQYHEDEVYTTVRATFRYGGAEPRYAGRTDVNSNLATIRYY